MEHLLEKAHEQEVMLADGLNDALIAIGEQSGMFVAIYSTKKVLEALMAQGMDYQEAVDNYDFNIACAYVGEGMPVFVDDGLG